MKLLVSDGGRKKRKKERDGELLATAADDINYKDINYGGNVCHYNNTKHMSCSESDQKPYKMLAYLLCVINTRPTVLLY